MGCFGRIVMASAGAVLVLVGQLFIANGFSRRYEAVTPSMTARSVDHEVALARINGLSLVAERTVQQGLREDFTLRPGGCFSLVASTTGTTPLSPLQIRDASGQTVGDDPDIEASGYVRHVSWCALLGGRFSVDILGGTTLHVLRFEGEPPRSLWPLARTHPTDDTVATLQQEIITSRFEAARGDQTPLTVWDRAPTDGATLLPDTPATRALLRAALVLPPREALPTQALAATPPSLQRYSVDEPARTEGGQSPTRAASLTLLGDTLRMVAALDVGAFHRRCVTLRAMPTTPSSAPMYRVDVPGWRVHALAMREGFFTDRRCITDPLAVYAVQSSAELSLRVALDTDAGAEDLSLTASVWRGEPAAHSLFTRLQTECVRDANACMTLGFLAGAAIPPPLRPDPIAAYRQACLLNHAEGCARLASAADSPVAAQGHLGHACQLGMAAACALHAERARLGLDGVRFDAAVAMASYERGCTLGDTAACHQRDTMRLLQLAP